MAKISRRDFLKGTAAGAMGLAALGLAPGVEVAKAEEKPELTAQQAVAKLNPQDYDYRSRDTDMAAIFSDWKFGGLTLHEGSYDPAARRAGQGRARCRRLHRLSALLHGTEVQWL